MISSLFFLFLILSKYHEVFVANPLGHMFANDIIYNDDNIRSDGVGTVTQEEKEKFAEIKERLRVQLEYQLTNFRFCFPFGRPEGALKSTLSLLERVVTTIT